jgi:catechol 2,3-dioxygenase-like lactoylglutathione lyase family enzyme
MDIVPPASISTVALVVRDYDEALRFFVEALRFRVLEDLQLSAEKRWLVVAPPDSTGARLLLAKAANPEQLAHVGEQTGGRVFLFMETGDFDGTYAHMKSQGVRFTETPRAEAYGMVVVFLDLYGNKWDLIGRRPPTATFAAESA